MRTPGGRVRGRREPRTRGDLDWSPTAARPLLGHSPAVAQPPAVLGITAATTHIPDRATVTIDPSTGRVTLDAREPVRPT